MMLGVYEHFKKGHRYKVIGSGRDCDTLEDLVIYESLWENPPFPQGTVWVRTLRSFTDVVKVNGEEVPRFRWVGEA